MATTTQNLPVPSRPSGPVARQSVITDKPLGQDHVTTTKPVSTIVPYGRSSDIRRDRQLYSDESVLTKQIESTNATDAEELNVRPVLSVVEDILRLAKPSTFDITTHEIKTIEDQKITTTHHHSTDDKIALASQHNGRIFHNLGSDHDSEILKILAYHINRIYSEIISKCTGGGESHAVTMDLLRALSDYAWDAKVVISLAAFSIIYGEFWLVEQLHTKNSLARNIAALKDLPGILAHPEELRKKIEGVLELLTVVLKVTRCIVEFKELPSQYISRQSPEIMVATAHIPTGVYWVMRSLLVCASTILNLVGTGYEHISSTAESWEILNLAHKLSVILEHLESQLKICKDLIEKKKMHDKYNDIVGLMEAVHIDNIPVLKALISSKENLKPLYDGTKRTHEPLEVLRLKYVLLLITDLDVPIEEIHVLHMIYSQTVNRHEYEVLWLPIVDPTTPLTQFQESTFITLRNSMPWYSTDHPSLVDPVAIRYIREHWKFVHMPILVVLNPQGKPSNLDALPMMWIWGSSGFDFTRYREITLWQGSVWNMELLADNTDHRIPEWMKLERVICLYGGEDIEWIRRFTRLAKSVSEALRVPLEMLYVGKRNPKEKVRRCHEVIQHENLSHFFPIQDYSDYVWYFWVRLWSMWSSKKQIGMSIETDPIMQQIMDLLTFDSSEQGWAVFSRGNYEITKGNGDKVIQVLENNAQWADRVDHPNRFVEVLDEELRGVHPEHHCHRLILPGHAWGIPEKVSCSECGKFMDRFVMYRCCDE